MGQQIPLYKYHNGAWVSITPKHVQGGSWVDMPGGHNYTEGSWDGSTGVELSLIGVPPFFIVTNISHLVSWSITGAAGGVGDLVTDSSSPYYGKYKISVVSTNTSGDDTTNIYLNAPLSASDTITSTSTGIVIGLHAGTCTITVGTTVQPSQMSIVYRAAYNPSYYYKTSDNYRLATSEGYAYRLKGE